MGLTSRDRVPSERTFTRFRTATYEFEKQTGRDLIHEALKPLFSHLQDVMECDKNIRRMDSFTIASNIRNLSRLGILYEANHLVLKELDSKKVKIPEELSHYLKKDDYNALFYWDREKLSYEQKSELLAGETVKVRKLSEENGLNSEAAASQERVFHEQLILDGGNYRLRKNKEEGLNSTTVKSPHDPDATYRKKAGVDHVGYAANVSEVGGEDGSMIEDYAFDQNTKSDVKFLEDYLENEPVHEEDVDLITDGGYASEELSKKAKQKGITLTTTALTGKKPDEFKADFEFDEDGKMTTCPNGKTPLKASVYKNGQCRAVFDQSVCKDCPHKDKCNPKPQKETNVVMVSKTGTDRAKFSKDQKEEAFHKKQNFRNGVESIPSMMRNKYSVDKMPVRGKIRSKILFGFKMGALAFSKFEAFVKRKFSPQPQCA